MIRILLTALVVLVSSAAGLIAEEMPDDVRAAIAACDTKCHEIKAKSDLEIAAMRLAMVNRLKPMAEREAKAKHDDRAAAIRAYIGDIGSDGVVDLPWPEFLKTVEVVSTGYLHGNGAVSSGACSIRVGNYSPKMRRGLNFLAMRAGRSIFENAYESEIQLNDLVNEFEKLPDGCSIVMAVQDEVVRVDHPKALACMRRCGAREGVMSGVSNTGYILIGRKGMRPGEGIELFSEPEKPVNYPKK